MQSKLDAGAAAARVAYSRLAGFLESELLPVAPEKDAVGRERYALASRAFLGAAVDLEETYAWGVQELDRLIAEQERVAEEIRPGATIEEAKEILNNDPARQLKGTDALQAWMQELSDKAVADLAGVHFDIPDVMKTLECLIAPTDEGGIYYTGPSDDFSRPGRMWWSVPPGEDTFTTWAETTTVYHEGVPGHHLQVATATYRRELLNKWRRNVCWTSGHGEGWALYAEKLMQELGYLKDPGDHMGMLDMQRMRAARVVFDIGVHLELEVPAALGLRHLDPGQGLRVPEAEPRHQRGPAQLRVHPLPRLAGPGAVLQGGPAALGADPRRARIPPRLRPQGVPHQGPEHRLRGPRHPQARAAGVGRTPSHARGEQFAAVFLEDIAANCSPRRSTGRDNRHTGPGITSQTGRFPARISGDSAAGTELLAA